MTDLTISQPDSDPDPAEGNRRHRKVGKSFLCSIDEENGISFSADINIEEITFEIQDKSGNIVGIFVDEFDFIEVLFSLQGEYKLVFTTSDYYLTGWITL